MVIFLLCFLALIAAGLFIAPYVKAWIYRLRDHEPYDPRFTGTTTDDLMAVARAAGLPKPGSDLDGDLPTGFLTELYDLIDAYKRGEDVTKDAPKEMA